MCCQIVRAMGQRGPIRLRGEIVATLGLPRDAEVKVRFGVRWLERDRPLEAGDRLVQRALCLECHAEVVERLRVISPEGNRLP